MAEKKLNGTVIVTYRCNARCTMCNRYKCPSKPDEELSIETIKKLPKMYFTNITGGEPFIREDLQDVVEELYKKSDRIVISTNGFFTDRIIAMAKRFPNIGIRISIEGLEKTNNEIRGLKDGYKRGYETLKKLKEMGMKDVGFGMTVQDKNAPDLVPLYEISNEMDMEFATASLHNSFYFVEAKNIIKDRPMVAQNFENLVNELLASKSPKKWFRAYFNHGLINYIYGQKRLLPCDMSFDTFFIDPYGDNLLHWNELAVLRIRRASFPGTPVLHTGSFGPCHSSCCHKILQGRCKDLYCRHDNARHRAYIGFDLVLLAVLWNSNVLPRRCLRRINHIIRHGNVHILYA